MGSKNHGHEKEKQYDSNEEESSQEIRSEGQQEGG
jgi:hypothetical protein